MREQNELSLEEVQRESMRMLSVIDRACVTNGIRYSLGYGSLIGAVRHKGFIPWDDDVDLIMTRPEYEKFVRLVNNDGVMRDNRLKFFAPELGNAFFNIAHVCDMQRTRVRKYNQWTDEDTGMWISVFPIDSLPADNGALIRRQSKVCFHVCGARVPLLSGLGLKRALKVAGKRLLYGWRSRDKEIARYLRLVRSLPPYGSTARVCNMGSPYGSRDVHRKEVFDEYVRLPFGELTVSAIKGFHEYLTAIYGNYMQPPPIASQVRGHSVNRYFWK